MRKESKLWTRATICERAKQLLYDRGESVVHFCAYNGYCPETFYSNQRNSGMSTDILYRLCCDLNVTADYLLGLED